MTEAESTAISRLRASEIMTKSVRTATREMSFHTARRKQKSLCLFQFGQEFCPHQQIGGNRFPRGIPQGDEAFFPTLAFDQQHLPAA